MFTFFGVSIQPIAVEVAGVKNSLPDNFMLLPTGLWIEKDFENEQPDTNWQDCRFEVRSNYDLQLGTEIPMTWFDCTELEDEYNSLMDWENGTSGNLMYEGNLKERIVFRRMIPSVPEKMKVQKKLVVRAITDVASSEEFILEEKHGFLVMLPGTPTGALDVESLMENIDYTQNLPKAVMKLTVKETATANGYILDDKEKEIVLTYSPYLEGGNKALKGTVSFDGKVVYDTRVMIENDELKFVDTTHRGIQGDYVELCNNHAPKVVVENNLESTGTVPKPEPEPDSKKEITDSFPVYSTKPDKTKQSPKGGMPTGVETVSVLIPASILLGSTYILTRKKR